jgi:rhomboid protease GluP
VAAFDDVVIFRSPRRARCAERAMVLMAMNITHRVRLDAGAWALTVPEHLAQQAASELDAYARENRDWPRRRKAMFLHPAGFDGVAGYVMILVLVAVLKKNMFLDVDWLAAGRMQTGLVRDGQWWRTVTALTLHLDSVHLIGNLLLGSVFGYLAGRLLGNGLAWFSILVAGAAGNALNAMVQPATHSAVGASTAVFAALGLLAAYVWRRRHDLKDRWAIRWAPIVGAVVLLAFTGSGGERTDIVAHLTGFLAGIALGAWYGGYGLRVILGARSQRLLGAAAVVLLVLAWTIAVAV